MTGDTDPCLYPCTTLALPLVLGNVQQIASRNGCNPSFPPAAFLCPHPRPVLHTTRPVSFTPHVLEAVFASHHASCKLHTGHPAHDKGQDRGVAVLGIRVLCSSAHHPFLQSMELHTINLHITSPHTITPDTLAILASL